MNTKKVVSTILLFVTAIIWGSAFVAQTVGMKFIGPFVFNFSRNILAGIALIPCIFILDKVNKNNPEKKKISSKKQLMIAGLATGVALFLGATFQQIGIQYTTTAKSGFITALYIVIVPVLALFIGKKSTIKIWISVLIAIVGFYFLSIKSDLSINKGDIYTLIGSVCFSLHILTIDHFSSKVDIVRMSCIQFFTAGLISLVPALIFETFDISALQAALIPILYAGLLSSAVGYTFQMIAQKNIEPTIASLVLSLESVFAALAGWIALNQTLSAREIMGCAIVFLAILYAQTPDRRRLKN